MSNTVHAAATRPAAGPAGGGRARHRGLALGLILAAQLLVVIDTSIVTLALPAIQHALGFSPAGLERDRAYALAFGGFLLVGERPADLLGRRRFRSLAAVGGPFTRTRGCGIHRARPPDVN